MLMLAKLGRAGAGLVLGALPGVLLVLLVELVIIGEWQLTIGVLGIVLAVSGAVAGSIVGFVREPDQP